MARRNTCTPNQELPPTDFRAALKASVAAERPRADNFNGDEKAVIREALLSSGVEWQDEGDVTKAQLCLALAKEFR